MSEMSEIKSLKLEVGLLKQRIINMTECISDHEGRIQNLEKKLNNKSQDLSTIGCALSKGANCNTCDLKDRCMVRKLLKGENSVPKEETVFMEKPSMDERGKMECSLQNSTPEELREIYMNRFLTDLKFRSSKDIMIKAGEIITESLDKFSKLFPKPHPLVLFNKIDKKRVQDALNKCFGHTLNDPFETIYKGIIQLFPNAIYNIDGENIVELYNELEIENNIDLKKS